MSTLRAMNRCRLPVAARARAKAAKGRYVLVRLLVLAAAGILLNLPGTATAAPGGCTGPTHGWQPVYFPSPGVVMLPPANASYPVKLWSATASSATAAQLVCPPNAANSAFDYLMPSAVANGTTMMPTNIANLAMQISYAGVDLQWYGGQWSPPSTITAYPIPSNGNNPVTLGAPSTLTLYATGPITPGTTLSG